LASGAKSVDLDLAKKSATVTVPAGETSVRLLNTKVNKEYVESGRINKRPAPTDPIPATPPPAACTPEAVKKAADTASSAAGSSEGDVAKAVDAALKDAALKDCSNKESLRSTANDRTALTIIPKFKLDAGASATITIDDSVPWTFTLIGDKAAHVDLDMSTSTGAFERPPGEVKVRLTNVLPGKEYHRLPNGATVKNPPATKDAALTDACAQAAIDALNKATSETDATAKVKDAVAKCTDDTTKTALAASIADARTIAIDSETAVAGEAILMKFERPDDKTLGWTFSIIGSGAKLEADAHPKLDELRKLTESSPNLVTLRCSYTDEVCKGDAIYVNADQLSTVYITDVEPGGKMTVHVSAGESLNPNEATGCSALNFNEKAFLQAPDRLVFPLTMKGGAFGLGGARWSNVVSEAERLYGLKCTNGKLDAEDLRGVPQPTKDPNIPLVLKGRSSLLTIQVTRGNKIKTFSIPIRYQRFWMDAGGFFVFSKVRDQFLETEAVGTDKTKVLARRDNTTFRSSTGIVVNVHPGNYPIYAFQFGISAADDRLPSYYFGLALRARELGRRALATVGIGLALQQEDRYPFVANNDVRANNDPVLTASRRYGIKPYVSLAFGFSFGGVSERTDVAASVTTTK
jgi:hypothetical protein